MPSHIEVLSRLTCEVLWQWLGSAHLMTTGNKPVLVECLLQHEASLQQCSSHLAKAHAATQPTAAPDDSNSSKSTDTQVDVAPGSTDSTGTGLIPDLDTRWFPRAAQASRTARHGNRPCFHVSHSPLPTQVSIDPFPHGHTRV